MRFGSYTPTGGGIEDGGNCHWHRLVLDTEGCVTGASGNIEQLLGTQVDELVGKCVTAILPDLPISEMTPGYNLAYVVFNSAKMVRFQVRCANGDAIAVDSVLSSHHNGHAYGIALALRESAN